MRQLLGVLKIREVFFTILFNPNHDDILIICPDDFFGVILSKSKEKPILWLSWDFCNV